MKRSALAIVLFASIAALGLYAQSISLKANIPFEFHAGTLLMPAGEYNINHSNGVLVLRGSTGRSAVVMTAAQSPATPENPRAGKLVFNVYGDRYFLSKVWDPNVSTGRVLPKGKVEKELIARGTAVQTAGVLARVK
jgi:hypothetical protein